MHFVNRRLHGRLISKFDEAVTALHKAVPDLATVFKLVLQVVIANVHAELSNKNLVLVFVFHV